ncbi:MAG: AAA family ATPase [Bacteroidetes bacterium]|nr:AAA family ATPase [Bacteroidota bacterium]
MLFGPSQVPLAERMRPQTLDDYVGQRHLVGEGQVLRRMIASGHLASFILWGPPGVGKTTLARIVASSMGKMLFQLSAISAGVKDVREIIARAEAQGDAVLFIDEIHRFSKSQQDSLLGAVEKGVIKLIGATTENPSFEVIGALLSRCQVYVLQSLTDEDLLALAQQALTQDEWLRGRKLELSETRALLQLAGGDARKLLSLLELTAQALEPGVALTDEAVSTYAQQRLSKYDKGGEQHYDIISAFIKSLRGSDPNGALYWLARMTEGGEDPAFIARRMVILASEDIGNANPNALLLATSCFQAVKLIGYPECRLTLAQTAVFLATSAKSNAVYTAMGRAEAAVRAKGDLPVPLPLRNAPTRLMKDLDYGGGYRYAHDFPGNFVEQDFLPEALRGTAFYQPGENAREREVREWLRARWKERYGY